MSNNKQPDYRMLETKLIEPNNWNPYEIDKETFKSLMENMSEEDFDDPVLVTDLENGKYRVIDGEHRLSAAVMLGLKEIPCIVKKSTDEDKQKLQTIRRNQIRGDINNKKFTRLVQEYCKKNQLDQILLAKKMCFKNSKEFLKHIVDAKKRDKEILGLANKEDKSVSERLLKKLVEDILVRNKENINYDYLSFDYKGKEFVAVQMSKDTYDLIKRVLVYIQSNNTSFDSFLKKSLSAELASSFTN